MPGRIVLDLQLPEGEKLVSSMGSIFHGALMGMLPWDMADDLHKNALRPYSQYVHFERDSKKQLWELSTLDDNVFEAFIEALTSRENIFLRHKNYVVSYKALEQKNSSYEALADIVFDKAAAPVGVKLSFVTTCSFKRDGEYMIFPDIRVLLEGLLNKWQAFATIALEEDNLIENLASNCRIARYELRTQKFQLEGHGLTGFAGKIQISFRGNEMLRRILGLVMLFAEYSGVGIKTALGMGAVRTELIYRE